MNEIRCPHCQEVEKQVKAGFTYAGSQRILCKICQKRYTPNPKDAGYPQEMRHEAVEMYVDDTNFRAISRRLKVNHQTVINWINAYATQVPEKPPIVEGPIETAELDELFTFIGDKKNKAYIITVVDRYTRCFLQYEVVQVRSTEEVQSLIDDLPAAKNYFSDNFSIYWSVDYGRSRFVAMRNKSETFSVEGGNAELRHYLARLTRRSRCFSRTLDALKVAVKLFVNAWNRRQIHNRTYPNYKLPVCSFACTLD